MAGSKSDPKPAGQEAPVEQEAASATQPDVTPLSKNSKKPPKPSQCRNYLRKAVAESMPTITDTFVGEAAKGSVSHLNLLSKLAGFDQKPVPAPSKRRAKSFIRRLLDNMKEHETKMIATNEARIAAERAGSK